MRSYLGTLPNLKMNLRKTGMITLTMSQEEEKKRSENLQAGWKDCQKNGKSWGELKIRFEKIVLIPM